LEVPKIAPEESQALSRLLEPSHITTSEDCEPELHALIEKFRKRLHLPDAGVVLVTLAAVQANRFSGNPTWLLLIGPSSSGKTECLQHIVNLGYIHNISTLTEAALLSGTKAAEVACDARGGILKEIGSFGIIVMKDFTSILSMHREKLQKVLAALREIYDGRWVRRVGTDGGKKLDWAGKVGLIGACTTAIDTHHSVLSTMGQRFMYYRMPKGTDADDEAQSHRAIENNEDDAEQLKMLTAIVASFTSKFKQDVAPALSKADRDTLTLLAMIATRGRSPVERDPVTREVMITPQAELPARLARMLGLFASSLRAIGVREREVWRLLVKVALDSIPSPRREVLVHLAGSPGGCTVKDLAYRVRCSTSSVRRALEDLTLHGLTVRIVNQGDKEEIWTLSTWCVERLTGIVRAVSEMSETQSRPQLSA
jgi:hypothetical protein